MQKYSRLAIKKLSNRNLKENKVRSLLIIAVIAILTMLITSLNIISDSIYKSLENVYFQRYGGTSHVILEGVSEQEQKSIENYTEIKEYGVSIWIGNAVNKEFGGRPTQIRFGDTNYAKHTLSLPLQGRMPENENEIALDTSVLKDLGIKSKLGEMVRLKWIGKNGIENSRKFEVTGIWSENEWYPNRNIWVAESFAEKAADEIDMVLMFKKDFNIETSYRELNKKTGIFDITAKVNWIYASENRIRMHLEAMAYRIGAGCVLLCGFLVLYNIIQVSIVTNIKLYGRIMAVGANSKQVQLFILRQMHFLALPGIIVGQIFGYVLGTRLVSLILMNSEGEIVVTAKTAGFVISSILIYSLIMLSSIIPAVKASKVNLSDLLNEENIYSFHQHGSRRVPGLPTLFQMSISYISRFKKRNLITILLLSVGLIGLSCTYVVNNSFDVEKYMGETSISDFIISEKTLVSGWGNYDSKGTTISEDVADLVDGIEGVREKGRLYSQDVLIKVPDSAFLNITEYYEQNEGEILKYMGKASLWGEGYRKFKNSKVCMASVFGVDGIVCDKILSGKIVEGTVDKEKFIMGDYAIAQGLGGSSANRKQPTYNVGENVSINGKDFEIMAIIDIPYPIVEGKENEDAAFNLKFFIPKHRFQEMYPENTIRRLFFNVNTEYRLAAECFVEKNFVHNGIPTVSRKSLVENYKKETKSIIMITNIIVYMIFAIGIINLLNSVITSVHVRQKEFAMMQSIGMTRRQLRILLIFEGVNIIGITLIISYFISFILISTGVKAYLTTQWTTTYQFTITSLLIVTPILIFIVVVVPLICLRHMQKAEIMDRLYGDIEMSN